MLEAEGLEVHVVGLGCEAEPALLSFRPDILMLDIGLPDVDGLALYEELRTRWPDLPVLFSTGHGDATKVEGFLDGHVGLLQKPYDSATLLSALQKISASGVA